MSVFCSVFKKKMTGYGLTALRSHYISQITEEARKYSSSGAAETEEDSSVSFPLGWAIGRRCDVRQQPSEQISFEWSDACILVPYHGTIEVAMRLIRAGAAAGAARSCNT